jgi:DNA polymerase Ligase (LigD)
VYPIGNPARNPNMPRFVVLEHDWPAPHWDFLLEAGPVLKAWRLLAEPRYGFDVPVETNADHRLFYLDYEGPVSGGRGTVSRWDAGTFEWHSTEFLRVRLYGSRLRGTATIVSGRWRVERDVPAAGPGDDVGRPEVK